MTAYHKKHSLRNLIKKKKSNDVFVIIDVTQINSSPVHSKDESLH